MRWVDGEAAKHITAASMRKRIALAREHLRALDSAGFGDEIAKAREAGAQLVLFPEQTVTGYPAEDLGLKPHFLDAARKAVDAIASGVGEIVALVGFPERDAATYNSVAVLGDVSPARPVFPPLA